MVVFGFTDALKKKHTNLEQEHQDVSGKLAIVTAGGLDIPKLEAVFKNRLAKLHKNVENLPKLPGSPKCTLQQRERLRTALQNFLGNIPLQPDDETGTLTAP
jgi:hypothetical protein